MWQEPLNTQKTKLTVQLRKIQEQVKEAYNKLKRSSVFNAKMFLEVFAVNRILKKWKTCTESFSVNLLVFYHECCSLIGYFTHYLF